MILDYLVIFTFGRHILIFSQVNVYKTAEYNHTTPRLTDPRYDKRKLPNGLLDTKCACRIELGIYWTSPCPLTRIDVSFWKVDI